MCKKQKKIQSINLLFQPFKKINLRTINPKLSILNCYIGYFSYGIHPA